MLHGEVHGALEALDAGIDHLPRKPPERLLDVQVEVGVVQVVVPQPCWIGSPDHTHAADPKRAVRQIKGTRRKMTKSEGNPAQGRGRLGSGITVFPEARGDGVHVEARERVAARVHQPVGQRVHQRRHGGGAGTGTLFLVLCGGGTRCPSPPRFWGREEELWWACVGAWTRSRAGAFGD